MTDYARHKWVTDQCSTGKRGYPERAGAKEVAKFMSKTGNPGTHVYRCAECRNWHVGHLPSAVRRGEVSAQEWYQR